MKNVSFKKNILFSILICPMITTPLFLTSCGFYKIDESSIVETTNPINQEIDSNKLNEINIVEAENLFNELNWIENDLMQFKNFVDKNINNAQLVAKFMQEEINQNDLNRNKIEKFILSNLYNENFNNKEIFKNFYGYNQSPLLTNNNIENLFKNYLNINKLDLKNLSNNVLSINLQQLAYSFIDSTNNKDTGPRSVLIFNPSNDLNIKQEFINNYGVVHFRYQVKLNNDQGPITKITINQIDPNNIKKGFYLDSFNIHQKISQYDKFSSSKYELISESKSQNESIVSLKDTGFNLNQIFLKFLIKEFKNDSNI